jgi:RsiW-degrading membrane proteinase PrsW (M82 family)
MFPALHSSVIVASAIAPALLLLWLVVTADSRPEPPKLVLIAVLLGTLSAILAAIVETVIVPLLPASANPLSILESSFLLTGVPEETLKVACIAAIGLRANDFDEPMDGVVYGAAVGLGFAAFENFFYLWGEPDWISVAIMRGLLTIPFHGSLGAIAGAYIARARFGGALGADRHSHWRRPRLLVSAWLVPAVLHGLFDTAVMLQRDGVSGATDAEIGIFGVVMLVTGITTIVFAVRLALRVAHRQKAWLQTKRLPPTDWRGVWAQSLIAVGLSIVAGALLFSGSLTIGVVAAVMMIAAIAVAWRCAKYLTAAAMRRRQAAP